MSFLIPVLYTSGDNQYLGWIALSPEFITSLLARALDHGRRQELARMRYETARRTHLRCAENVYTADMLRMLMCP
jgi:hypothetical protein